VLLWYKPRPSIGKPKENLRTYKVDFSVTILNDFLINSSFCVMHHSVYTTKNPTRLTPFLWLLKQSHQGTHGSPKEVEGSQLGIGQEDIPESSTSQDGNGNEEIEGFDRRTASRRRA
jgi:hypothetical protein